MKILYTFLTCTLLAGVFTPISHAAENAAGGSGTAQSGARALDIKLSASNNKLQTHANTQEAMLNRMAACHNQRKFYNSQTNTCDGPGVRVVEREVVLVQPGFSYHSPSGTGFTSSERKWSIAGKFPPHVTQAVIRFNYEDSNPSRMRGPGYAEIRTFLNYTKTGTMEVHYYRQWPHRAEQGHLDYGYYAPTKEVIARFTLRDCALSVTSIIGKYYDTELITPTTP